MHMVLWCFPISGLVVITVIGVNLMVYGRTRALRRVGAVLGSVLGPGVIWLSGRMLWSTIYSRLWLHSPLDGGNTLVLGRDVTLSELIWPRMGIRNNQSHFSTTKRLMPWPSLPNTTTTGIFKSTWR